MLTKTCRGLAPALLATCLLLACQPTLHWHGTDVTGFLPDLSFELTDAEGQPVNDEDFRGGATLLFFGFTHCPGPCPTTLSRIGMALDSLNSNEVRVKVLMVSVDPDRDTPEAMARFSAAFGPWLHGLTGDPVELDRLRMDYKVYAQRLLEDGSGDYDVEHGTAVFGFDAQGRCRVLWSSVDQTDRLVEDLEQLLAL